MLNFFFRWYDGNVWGNVIATVICAVPAYLWGKRKVKKHITAMHTKIDKIHEHLGITDGN